MQRIIAVLSSAFLFYSCSNKSDSNLAVLKTTEEGLRQSNNVISNSTAIIYRALDGKLLNPATAQQALKWQPKATLIKEKSGAIINYINSLVTGLKKEAGLKMIDSKEVYEEDNLVAVNHFLLNEKGGEELFQKLEDYKRDILDIDPEINKVFGATIIITTRSFEVDENNAKNFIGYFFKNISAIAAVTLLDKFENNVRVIENVLVTFCLNKIGSTDSEGFFTKINAIISQSANTVKAGDFVIIKAGLGEFSIVANPKISINRIAIPLDDAVATYKFKSPLKAGKYYVPVKIDYIDPNGIKQTKTEKVEYTVIE